MIGQANLAHQKRSGSGGVLGKNSQPGERIAGPIDSGAAAVIDLTEAYQHIDGGAGKY